MPLSFKQQNWFCLCTIILNLWLSRIICGVIPLRHWVELQSDVFWFKMAFKEHLKGFYRATLSVISFWRVNHCWMTQGCTCCCCAAPTGWDYTSGFGYNHIQSRDVPADVVFFTARGISCFDTDGAQRVHPMWCRTYEARVMPVVGFQECGETLRFVKLIWEKNKEQSNWTKSAPWSVWLEITK